MAQKLPVTELAKMGYCETLLMLNKKYKNSDKQHRDEKAINRGNKEHDAFDERVKKQHKPYYAAAETDKRCFIATCVYGPEHPKTKRLRQYRDVTLTQTSTGRALVGLYYRVSPFIVRLLELSNPLKRLTTRLLDNIIRRLK